MIGFLHPWVLAGLLAAAVPILLHLVARREPPTVVFPAVRYLITTTRENQKRLRLEHWLLLLFRTLLIASLVMAAAGPTIRLSGVPGHSPTALVVMLDNSPSSTVVAGGTSRLSQLKAAARAALERATPSDGLWLLTADGTPRRGDRAALIRLVDSLAPSARRMDLGAALTLAGSVLGTDPRPGELMMITDLQATAVSAATPAAPLVVVRPEDAPPPNLGVAALATGAQPWSTDGGRVVVTVAGDSTRTTPVMVQLDNRPGRQALANAGSAVTVNVPGAPAGWRIATAELDADELKADDRRSAYIRVAPVARVFWDPGDRYVAAACDVLVTSGRLARGSELTLGALGAGFSVVYPPSDPAAVGALNRALARRGVAWHFGAPSDAPVETDSSGLLGRQQVLRRYALESNGSGRTGVLATAGGAPWAVRSGGVVLLGSRLEPEWTGLPLAAGFVPFLDRLLNRVARGELSMVDGVPGEPVALPDLATEVRLGQESWKVEGGDLFRPSAPGAHLILAGTDTIGSLNVGLDPRESALERMGDREIRRLWKGARLVPLADGGGAAFSSRALADGRGPLLWAALVCGLGELFLASIRRRRP
jgi:hypothetical protein